MKRPLLIASFIFSALLAGCQKQQNENEILIGYLASMTGSTATFGVSSDEGLNLAVDEINAAGGVLGKQIKIALEDDASVTSQARTAASTLINRDHVVALLGEIASSRSIAAAPVAQAAKIPMLSPGSTNPKVTQEGDYIFRSCFIDPFQGTAGANFAIDHLHKNRFAILWAVNSDYSVGLHDFFKEAATKRGATIVAEESYTENSDKDFKGQLTKIKAANPDAIYIPGYYTEAGLIAKQARELDIQVPLIGGDGWDSEVTLESGGAALHDCYFTNHYAPDEDRPQVKKFIDAYKAKYNGKVPDAMAILGYDAMKLIADAITRAGSTDGEKIRDALAATKNFEAASGTITIDENRNANKPAVIVQVKDGKFQYVTQINP